MFIPPKYNTKPRFLGKRSFDVVEDNPLIPQRQSYQPAASLDPQIHPRLLELLLRVPDPEPKRRRDIVKAEEADLLQVP